ncbi:MAG: hypothetical protein V1834_04935, partial [Candidatus Micrarchaeota archaeon]
MRLLFWLLVLTPLACGLSEYSHVLETGSPDTLHLLVLSKPCAGFLQPVQVTSSARNDSSFSESTAHARQANAELLLASGDALAQLVTIPANSPAIYGYYSFSCFSHGVAALNYAVESARAGFKAIDKKQEELRNMIDDDYAGEAAGVLAELDEIERDVANKRSQGTGLGKKTVNASEKVNAVWYSFGSLSEDAAQMVQSVNGLIGEDRVLEDSIDFHDRLQKAIDALEKERVQTGFQAQLELKQAG